MRQENFYKLKTCQNGKSVRGRIVMKISKEQHEIREDIVMRAICDNTASRLESEGKTKTKLASYLGITLQNLSKKLSGERKFSFYEILHISKFFHIQIIELLIGTGWEDAGIHETTGLSSYAINYLKMGRKANPHLMEMVDLVLENEDIANSLFGLLHLYSTSIISTMTFPIPQKPNEKILSNISDGSQYLRFLFDKYALGLYDSVKEKYQKHPKRAKLEKTPFELFQILQLAETALSQAGEDIYSTFSHNEIETFERVSRKLISIYGNPDERESWNIDMSDEEGSDFPILNI